MRDETDIVLFPSLILDINKTYKVSVTVGVSPKIAITAVTTYSGSFSLRRFLSLSEFP